MQKPFALSFHMPVLAVLRSADFAAMPFTGGRGSPADFGAFPFVVGGRGSRAIFPSGVKVILNLVPEGVVAVKA